ncbi:MAG TPA: cytochrome b/b6 domain-containing protein [Burkholderiales bacterium]|nr:cytochrome b/b6 domain-containing protein [Burkholderiales bacterium]
MLKVWDPFVRVAHWSLVAGIIAAWFTRKSLHEWIGYAALGIVVLRIVWGLIGPRYARFRQFVLGPAATLAYARAFTARVEPRYLGHNPLGGWMIVALLATVALTCASGWLSITDRFWGVEWVQETHAFLADALVALACLHVGGVAYTSLRHRDNLPRAMVTGYKLPPRQGDVV